MFLTCFFFLILNWQSACFFVKGKIREENIDKTKLKMRTNFKPGRNLHRPSAKTNNAAKLEIRLS